MFLVSGGTGQQDSGMASVDLTDAYLRRLKVTIRTEVTDKKSPGLLVRALPSGRTTFAFRMRKPGAPSGSQPQGCVIGTYPDLSLKQARDEAERLRRELREGRDITAASQRAAKAGADYAQLSAPTLATIIAEYEALMAPKRKIWKKTKTGRPSEAYHRVETVFHSHFDKPITDLTLIDLAASMANYKPESGKLTANGQVQKARAYLMPIFDWCAHRNKFDKVGLGRPVRLDVVNMRQTHDPASDDHSINGSRERALDHLELGRILPLLLWPAPERLKMGVESDEDLRPIAMRFLLLTCARREELVAMRWKDFREKTGIWHKPYVKTISGPPKRQSLPLSDAAIDLLRGLPGFKSSHPEELVFPNSTGGPLGNWGRITAAVQRESETTDWHRHDLRRTGSTIMKLLGVSPRVIDEILAHNASNTDEGTSRALENYFSNERLIAHVEDPQKVALDRLAAALAHIEREAIQEVVKPHAC